MRTTRRHRIALLATSVLALGLTACAQSGSADSTASATATSSEATETESAAADAEPLIIGTSGTYNPITFSDGGTLTGYDIEWGEAIGEELGRPVEFVEGQLAGLLTGLQSGQYDLVMSALTITPERQEAIDFSDPYLADGVVAVVVEGSDVVPDISDLTGVKVGVIGGSGYHKAVEAIGGYTELVEYPDAPSGFADLKNGRIDVFAAGKIPATTFVTNDSTGGSALEIAGEPLELLPAAVGVAKGNEELQTQVSEAIAAIRADGRGDALATSWFGFTIPGFTD